MTAITPLRILLASDSYTPVVSGVVTVVKQLRLGLARLDHTVGLVTMGQQFDHSVITRDDLGTRLMVRSIPNPVRPDHRLPLPSPAIARFADVFRPDVVHLHTPGPVCWQLRNWARREGVPVVYSMHSIPNFIWHYFPVMQAWAKAEFSWPNRLYWRSLRRFTNTAQRIIVPSQYLYKQAKLHGIEAAQLKCIPFWVVDQPPQLSGRAQTRQKSKLRFTYIGRLDKDKQVSEILNAWSKADVGRQAELVIAGSGTELIKLHQFVAQQGLSNSVRFAGYVNPVQRVKLLQKSNFFIIASQIEVQCLSAWEAAVFGLPVIAPRSAALIELLGATPYPELGYDPQSQSELTDKIQLAVARHHNFVPYQLPDRVIKRLTKRQALQSTLAVYRQAIAQAVI